MVVVVLILNVWGGGEAEVCDRELSSKPRIMKSNLPLMKVEKNSNKLKRARYEMTFLFVVNNEDI